MAEEKILEDEIIDDADLDGVAGGTYQETVADGRKLRDLGKFNWKGSFQGKELSSKIHGLSSELGVNIKYNYSHDNKPANEYKVNGKQLSRDEFWAIIDEGLAAKKN